jgi:uncharacterized membrane protein YedE/YeeE
VDGFTPISALVGGILIALSLAIPLVMTGRLAGLSGIIGGLLVPGDRLLRASFVVGALGVGLAFELARPETFDAAPTQPLWVVAIAGALVGLGTQLGNGCTSGHGLCGTSRLSRRSIIATIVFLGVGIATATITAMVIGRPR